MPRAAAVGSIFLVLVSLAGTAAIVSARPGAKTPSKSPCTRNLTAYDTEPPSLTRHLKLWPFSPRDMCNSVFIDLGTFDGNTVEAWYMLKSFLQTDDISSAKLTHKLGGAWCKPHRRQAEIRKLSAEFGVALNSTLSVRDRQTFCSMAFDGNPVFNSRLAALQTELKDHGKAVHMFSSTAIVVGHSRPVTFYVKKNN
eukprot:6891580-Prymnesium_polylepis.2